MSEVRERKKLLDTRDSITHRVKISTSSGDLTLFIIVGFYGDGTPGELFINMGKAGSTLSGLLDTIGILCSYALQYGVPLDALAHRMRDISFEPSGQTDNPKIPKCSSVIDYIFRWMGETFSEHGTAERG